MPLIFSYGQVFPMLAAAHSVPASRHTALRGRLQHFQKLGLPDGVRTGRGIPAKYGPAQFLDLLIAFELTQLGMTPEKAVRVVKANQKEVARAIAVVAKRMAKESGAAIFMTFTPWVFDLREDGEQVPAQMKMHEAEDTRAFLEENATRHLALAVFNLTFLVKLICDTAERLGFNRMHALQALDDWAFSVVEMPSRRPLEGSKGRRRMLDQSDFSRGKPSRSR